MLHNPGVAACPSVLDASFDLEEQAGSRTNGREIKVWNGFLLMFLLYRRRPTGPTVVRMSMRGARTRRKEKIPTRHDFSAR
jgi:hypothetical protein